jgi:hypothetical protein
MNVCVVITVTAVKLLREFEPYGIIFMAVTTLDFPVILDGQFISCLNIKMNVAEIKVMREKEGDMTQGLLIRNAEFLFLHNLTMGGRKSKTGNYGERS